MESARCLSAAPILPKIMEYSAELTDPSKNRGVFPRGYFLHRSATAAMLNSSRVYRGFEHTISFVFESWRERVGKQDISVFGEGTLVFIENLSSSRSSIDPSVLQM